MQLVLLSGGAGLRLWPLSNNTRSKQFLPLLERPDGTRESMVQRVVRQVRQAGLTTNITMATNAGQRDIIINQLGNGVEIVSEPERRDTFPAIALACSYLRFIKQCPQEEPVVIMPCDPYTREEYFHAIGRMVHCVEQNAAQLVLMGITPTYASEKYGYIVPAKAAAEAGDICLPVAHFTEKPSAEKARELLEQKAYWNGGVFAFRLGYMMDIVRRYVPARSFEETRSRYARFPKISFDYEVAEKAQSVAVVPFKGEWKDLGTWNSITEELHSASIGNAHMGSHCLNSHIINETHLPIYADGLRDMVVAAGPDGILVCAKEHSEQIKKEVENLTTRPMYEERRWGTYRVLDDTVYPDGHHALTKSITLLPGRNISYQIHHHRSEAWTFVEGEGIFVLDGVERRVKAGDTVVIPVEHLHAIKALTQLTFIEVQNGHPLTEEDIERFEWNWSE